MENGAPLTQSRDGTARPVTARAAQAEPSFPVEPSSPVESSLPVESVIFDTSSGISLDEQKEILDGINAMAAGSRLSGNPPAAKATKNGTLFPLMVNVSALAILGLGFFLLFFLHGQDEQNIRIGSATLGITERKLIQEIRLETGRQLNEKDDEINVILSKLSSVDAEYAALQDSMESLTEEQKERAALLLGMQEEYRSALSGLEEEKGRILENSRQQESALRAQAEERAGELSAQVEQSQASLSSAMEELRRLDNERERTRMAERQMSGFYVSLGSQLESGSLDEAARTVNAMKEFFSAASRNGSFSEAGLQTHMAAITAMEAAISDARRRDDVSSGGNRDTPAGASQNLAQGGPSGENYEELKAKFDELETQASLLGQKAADQEKALALLNSQGSDQGRMIAEYLSEIDALRTANSNQQQTLNRRDSEIVELRAENAENSRQASDLNSSISALRGELQAANAKAQESDTALAEQKNDYDALLAQRNELQRQYDDLQRRVETALRVVSD